jgi:replicative DNA helicase
MDVTPTAANVELYADLTRQAAQKRRIRALCKEVVEDMGGTTEELLGRLQTGVEAIAGRATNGKLLTSSEAVSDFLSGLDDRSQGKGAVLASGLRCVDQPLGGGFSPGGLFVIAGRPGMGKSTLALFLAERLAEQGPVLYVSLEMTPDQLTAKRLARATGIPAQRLLLDSGEGAFSSDEWDKITAEMSKLSKSGLQINRKMGANVSEVAVMAHQIAGLRAVFIDHLGLLQAQDAKGRSRVEQITEISGALKRLALALDVPVVALSQLNRSSELTENKRPTLANLRDSGSIEQDADVVMLLHRADYYQHDSEKKPWQPSLLEIDFAKNRFGRNSTGYASLFLAVDRVVDA